MNFHQQDCEKNLVYTLYVSTDGEIIADGDLLGTMKETTVFRLKIFLPQHLFAVPKMTEISV